MRRRVSTQTVEEPQTEPIPSAVPSSAEPSSDESKRRRISNPGGRAKKRISEADLQRQAVKVLRRLAREDKQRAREGAIAEPAMASGSAGAEQLQPGEEECAPDASQVINIEVDDDDDDLFSYFRVEPPSDNTNFLEIRPMEGGNLMAVQAKAKNSEFNMKEASKEDIVGFKLSDTNEWKDT